MHPHTIVLEQSSLELVPNRFWSQESCRVYESRFGIPPENQILDENFHSDIVKKLADSQKRGRPDVAHFALLDIVSTPAYRNGLIRPIIHTVNEDVIIVKDSVRLPRTELRFIGVMSKILRGHAGSAENRLFEYDGKRKIAEILEPLKPGRVFCLSTQGVLRNLHHFIQKEHSQERDLESLWIVGGFARGHFDEEVKSLSNDMISISELPLAAHVVTARLSYEIEQVSNLGSMPKS